MPLAIFGYVDSDFDGVDDDIDKCPNTSPIDLVDEYGCSQVEEEVLHHFDIVLGLKYIKIYSKEQQKDTYLTIRTTQLDYFYKNFSFGFSVYKNGSKYQDSYLSAKYKYEYNEFLTFYSSLQILLPMSNSYLNNNKTDYSLSQSIFYKRDNLSLFGAYRFTIVNDEDVENIYLYYQNTNSYTIGVGYDITHDLYSSISASDVESSYKNNSSAKSTNIYLLYTIDDNWFTNISYTKIYTKKITSDTVSLKIGYYY